MSEHTNDTWSCPLCCLQRMPYGTSCTDLDCRNRDYAHITGRWYLGKPLDGDVKAVGIGAISDEDITDGNRLKASKHNGKN